MYEVQGLLILRERDQHIQEGVRAGSVAAQAAHDAWSLGGREPQQRGVPGACAWAHDRAMTSLIGGVILSRRGPREEEARAVRVLEETVRASVVVGGAGGRARGFLARGYGEWWKRRPLRRVLAAGADVQAG